jgi:hypothetical protein
MSLKTMGAVLLGIVIFIGGALMFSLHSKNKIQPAPLNYITENQASLLASRFVIQKKLTTLSEKCIEEDITGTTTDVFTFDIREIHSSLCGGDPLTAPRITTVSINKINGTILENK